MNPFFRSFFVLITILTLLVGPVGVRAAEPSPSSPAAGSSTTESNQKPPEFSPALISCLKNAMGEAAYQAITSGDREATDAEFDQGETCFEQFGPKMDPTQSPKVEDLKFAPGTEKCLKEKLGDNF